MLFLLLQLSPPATEALKIMHTLASDPGIVAIMNKVPVHIDHFDSFFLFPISTMLLYLLQHRWRVGIMSELAPIGYVGVSPKCILGFNKVGYT